MLKNKIVNFLNYFLIFLKLLKGFLYFALFMLMFYFVYFYNNRLFLLEATLLWPQKQFNEIDFKNGATSLRSQMVVDLIKSEKLIGIDINQIENMLGVRNGDYYYSDSNVTYLLTEKGDADWILTIVSDDKGKVSYVFIRKSCCSITKKFFLNFENLISLFLKN